MKNKISITLGWSCIILCTILFWVAVFRAQSNQYLKHQSDDVFLYGIKTIQHDSCEYVILFKDKGGYPVSIIHKQNCMFCEKRSNK
jgi:hypothetical protein